MPLPGLHSRIFWARYVMVMQEDLLHLVLSAGAAECVPYTYGHQQRLLQQPEHSCYR
jgi:hypothetical protein